MCINSFLYQFGTKNGKNAFKLSKRQELYVKVFNLTDYLGELKVVRHDEKPGLTARFESHRVIAMRTNVLRLYVGGNYEHVTNMIC